jgi:deoxyribonuclease-4
VNDSRDFVGSKRDRHESIGKGTIGLEPFRALFSVAATRDLPMIVETVDDAQAADISTLIDLRTAARDGR